MTLSSDSLHLACQVYPLHSQTGNVGAHEPRGPPGSPSARAVHTHERVRATGKGDQDGGGVARDTQPHPHWHLHCDHLPRPTATPSSSVPCFVPESPRPPFLSNKPPSPRLLPKQAPGASQPGNQSLFSKGGPVFGETPIPCCPALQRACIVLC